MAMNDSGIAKSSCQLTGTILLAKVPIAQNRNQNVQNVQNMVLMPAQ